MNLVRAATVAISLAFTLVPSVSLAGFKDGVEAWKKKDYATSLREFKPLAEQGNDAAQFFLGVMYRDGLGVPQYYKDAVKWFKISASTGNSSSQANLGVMYANGQGVSKNPVIAYALWNISAAEDPSSGSNNATALRTRMANSLSLVEIEAAQDITRELAKPGNFIRTLDKFTNIYEAR